MLSTDIDEGIIDSESHPYEDSVGKLDSESQAIYGGFKEDEDDLKFQSRNHFPSFHFDYMIPFDDDPEHTTTTNSFESIEQVGHQL